MVAKITGAFILIALAVIASSCFSQEQQEADHTSDIASTQNDKKIAGNEILNSIKDIIAPSGFKRQAAEAGSFANFLGNLKLKKNKTVYLYDGREKGNQEAQYAVLDVSVPNQDLQQCADAVMRLRAEYLFAQQRFKEILFIDNKGGRYQFTAPYTRVRLDKYLLRVFGMCGTASLNKQLKAKVNLTAIEAGDVFIKGGFPGHAVIVMDLAVNPKGEKQFLLAQSYMPAQDIHVLKNPANKDGSPWYSVSDIGGTLETPEYRFTRDQLKTW